LIQRVSHRISETLVQRKQKDSPPLSVSLRGQCIKAQRVREGRRWIDGILWQTIECTLLSLSVVCQLSVVCHFGGLRLFRV